MKDGKQLARRIFLRTLEELDVAESISRCVQCTQGVLECGGQKYDLGKLQDLRVIAAGKAAYGMLGGLLAILPGGQKIRGIVSAPDPPTQPRGGFEYFLGGHPTPNEQSLRAGEAALELVRESSTETLIIVLLSGGGSALLEKPLLSSLSLADVQASNRALVSCGASITEINAVRKHMSALKGGRLAQAASPAKLLTLGISDVPIRHETALASGPTLPDVTSREQVLEIIAAYNLRERMPRQLMEWIDRGEMPETPKASGPAFAKSHFQLVLGMHDLFHAAHRIAEAEDCVAFCDNSTDDWPVEKAADELLSQLEKLAATNAGHPVALIADGELKSPVTGDGLGGRNSAFVLGCVEKIAGKPIAVLSGGTDGIDGNSPAAGAVADGETLSRAKRMRMNPHSYVQRSDSFRFFQALGDDITIGRTGNNLRDLRILIANPHPRAGSSI